MARRKKVSRRKFKEKDLVFAIMAFLTMYIIFAILQFIAENMDTLLNIFLIGLGLAFLFSLFKSYLYFDKLKKYKKTDYYKDTLLPYKILKNNLGLQFEVEVYNQLKQKFPNSLLLTNLLIARKGSINEYSEIDLIFFHQTGLYVLELKNYSGFIYGELSKEYWTVGYKNDKNRSSYEFLNPILQNNKHIEDLEKLTKFKYINHVIFSDKTKIDSFIDNVSDFNTFIDNVSKQEEIYSFNELKEAYHEIKTINTYEKISNHIERIKFNEQKYSQYRKK